MYLSIGTYIEVPIESINKYSDLYFNNNGDVSEVFSFNL